MVLWFKTFICTLVPALLFFSIDIFTGGSGQRPLTVIASESEGYIGPPVQTASSGGKTVFVM